MSNTSTKSKIPSEAAPDGAQPAAVGASGASVESVAPGRRRTFTAADKLRILKALDAATASQVRGAVGELLRREGVYSSQVTDWRRAMAQSGADGLAVRKPGRAPKYSAAELELAALRKKLAKTEAKLRLSEALIELQKKAHAIWGIALPEPPSGYE